MRHRLVQRPGLDEDLADRQLHPLAMLNPLSSRNIAHGRRQNRLALIGMGLGHHLDIQPCPVHPQANPLKG